MQKHYNVAIDVLRILAILAVILIHTTITTIQAADHEIATIPFTFFLNQIAVFAVPLFFLISGFVLELNYKALHYGNYFKKRATRIIVPYIFWSVFYIFAYPATIPKHTSFLYLLLLGKAAYQLYFIPAIILFYLLFPLLHKYYTFISQKKVLFFLLILELFLQIYDYFFGPFSIGNALRVTILSFVMFPLGMLAAHHEQAIYEITKKYIWYFLLVLLLLITIITIQDWYYFTIAKKFQGIYSQYSIWIIPYTLTLAAIVFFLTAKQERYKQIILKLSKLSFFVFFIHVAIIYTFWNVAEPLFIQTEKSLFGNLLFSLCFFFFVTGLSFFIADLIHRIPKISKLTG